MVRDIKLFWVVQLRRLAVIEAPLDLKKNRVHLVMAQNFNLLFLILVTIWFIFRNFISFHHFGMLLIFDGNDFDVVFLKIDLFIVSVDSFIDLVILIFLITSLRWFWTEEARLLHRALKVHIRLPCFVKTFLSVWISRLYLFDRLRMLREIVRVVGFCFILISLTLIIVKLDRKVVIYVSHF